MSLRINGLIAVSALAISTAAFAQDVTPAQPAQPAQPTTGKSDTAPGQLGTTPGQMQTTPGDASQNTPAMTGTTPSGETTATGQDTASGQVAAATEADFKKGATVYDSTGAVVGKVESVNSSAVTVKSGKVRAAIPLSSFGKGDSGLVLGMTKADFEAAASTAATKTKTKSKKAD